MAKFLDESGLTQFAGKIDDKFARKTSLVFDGIKSQESFTVNALGNTTIGAIKNGVTINSTDSLMDILKKMLLAKLNPTVKAKPSCSMSISGDKFDTTVEVGTEVTATLSASYTDGSFNSYKNSTTTEVIAAGCAQGDTTFYYNNVALTGNTKTLTLADGGSANFQAKITYSASTNIPKASDGTDATDVKISAGTASSSENKYTAYYMYFVGHVAALPTNSEGVRAMKTFSSWINSNSITLAKSNTTCPVKYLAVAVPKGCTVKVQNSLGADWTMEKSANDITVNIGGTSTQKYSLFYISPNGAAYKNLIITKGTITNN